MSSENTTRAGLKTRFGSISDYEAASRQLDEESYGELVADVIEYKGETYGEAQEIARAFHEEDHEAYNRNQCLIREVSKEEVTKDSQPDWAWDILSFHSDDTGTRMMDIPSEGQHKGLLVTDPEADQPQECFLYAKEDNDISDIQHIERYHLNFSNADSMGMNLPSGFERVCLEINNGKFYRGKNSETVAALKMDYNTEMVTTDRRLSSYLEDRISRPGDLTSELQDLWNREINRSHSQEDLESWSPSLYAKGNDLFDLSDLIEAGMFMNEGVDEFESTTGNLALKFPENWSDRWVGGDDEFDSRRTEAGEEELYESAEDLWEDIEMIVVDSGEYPEEIDLFKDSDEPQRRALEEDPILSDSQKEHLLTPEDVPDRLEVLKKELNS